MASRQVFHTVNKAGKGLLPRAQPKLPHEYGQLIKDPAIERWNHMRENTYPHFKFTKTTLGQLFFWVGVIPGATYYLIKEEVANRIEKETGVRPRYFPDAEMSSRRPDPLPPRKEGYTDVRKIERFWLN